MNDRLLGLSQLNDPSMVFSTPDPSQDFPAKPATIPIDIVFVHGLGGSARKTWTHPSSNQCWPEWLYEREDIDNVRILTFGYDANFKKVWAPRNSLGIQGFAQQLLYSLKLRYEQSGNVPLKFVSLVNCQTPTIFVAHSMGGLVVKKVSQILDLIYDARQSLTHTTTANTRRYSKT